MNVMYVSVWWQSHIGLSVKEVNEVITSCLFRVERDYHKWENNIQTKTQVKTEIQVKALSFAQK